MFGAFVLSPGPGMPPSTRAGTMGGCWGDGRKRRAAQPSSGIPHSPYSFDGDPTSQLTACSECGVEHQSVTGFVLRDGDAHAVYFAEWHPTLVEAYVDVILGSFEEPAYLDNVTDRRPTCRSAAGRLGGRYRAAERRAASR